jgi:hypothetical protein
LPGIDDALSGMAIKDFMIKNSRAIIPVVISQLTAGSFAKSDNVQRVLRPLKSIKSPKIIILTKINASFS